MPGYRPCRGRGVAVRSAARSAARALLLSSASLLLACEAERGAVDNPVAGFTFG